MIPWLIGFLFTSGLMAGNADYKKESWQDRLRALLLAVVMWPYFLRLVLAEFMEGFEDENDPSSKQ